MTPMLKTDEELAIRPACWEDMEAIAGFLRSTADWYRPFVAEDDMAEHDVPEEWKEDNFERRDFYVGELGDDPVGTVSLQFFGDHAYLGYIYLDADQVGKGYGQRLMDFAAAEARSQGMKGLALIAHPKATWATRAYRKFGFELVGRERAEVLAWNGGVLRDYYEEGFQLFVCPLASDEA